MNAVKIEKLPLQAKILIVEDDPGLREAVSDTLSMAGYEVYEAESGEIALQCLKQTADIACVVSDVNMGKMNGHELLKHIVRDFPHIPVILNTAYGSINRSVEAMRDGAADYLVKPFAPEVLLSTVGRYVNGLNHPHDAEPVAHAPASRQLLQLARRVAASDATALIIGESGTGKEVLARYIHQHSPRAKQPFIAINCAAIPENMLEAMLFGHEKGAFTGAYSSAPGKFEQANGGTLLLDEISEMNLGLQAKLLRVLQEREVERLGGRKTIQLDVRVIATSNRNMREYVAEGKFREDLYFRLSVLPLQWQPLRNRREDILPLANKLMQRHAVKMHRQGMVFAEDACQALFDHDWPGNVRELENVVQRALILQPGRRIHAPDLGLFADTVNPMTLSANDALETASDGLFQQPDSNRFKPSVVEKTSPLMVEDAGVSALSRVSVSEADLGDDLKQREFEIIVKTLAQERGSKKNTAARLGISPRTLRYKIARLREMGFDLNSTGLRVSS